MHCIFTDAHLTSSHRQPFALLIYMLLWMARFKRIFGRLFWQTNSQRTLRGCLEFSYLHGCYISKNNMVHLENHRVRSFIETNILEKTLIPLPEEWCDRNAWLVKNYHLGLLWWYLGSRDISLVLWKDNIIVGFYRAEM